MTKTLNIFLALFLTTFSLSYFLGSKLNILVQARDEEDSSNCGYTCPVIHWTWQTREVDEAEHYEYTDKVIDVAGHYGNCPNNYSVYSQDNTKCRKNNGNHEIINRPWVDSTYKCPSGYQSNPGHSNCRQLIATTYKNTDHSADVAYEKSSDGNHCHRPSDDTLEDTYDMDHDTREDFKDENSQNKDATPIACPTATPTTAPTSTPVSTSTPTPTPTSEITNTPTPTSTDETTNTPTPTQSEQSTGTPSPTVTPTNSPHVGGDAGSSNNNSAPTCNDSDPGTPQNLQAIALGGGKVKLTWGNASGPVTSYAVAYGPSIGNYLYGDPNVGNVNTYTVLALSPGGKYCFYVQAQNGCRGGSPSNVVCTNQGAGSLQVLGAKTNYNPLVDGIRQSYGGLVLGTSTELMATAEVVYSTEKLPSGNTLDETKSISIPKIGITQAIYHPQKIGDDLTVGHREVLKTSLNGATVYYGHNGYDVFGSLYLLRVGDAIKLHSSGTVSNYSVTSTQFVHKSNVEAIKSQGDQIVLVTCSFTQPDYRIIVTASIQK
ncbi:MAG: sortase [Microgenomates group bacterium]